MDKWNKKRDVMRRYDVTSRIYDMRYAEDQAAIYSVALKNLGLSGLGFVLDVGCGTGLLFGYIASSADEIVGLDISKETLLKARERAAKFQNVHLICADADAIPIKEKTFDHVFAFTIIQNLPKPPDTLKEIGRTAKPNAAILISGLRRIFSREIFQGILRKASLSIIALEDKEELQCYIAICTK